MHTKIPFLMKIAAISVIFIIAVFLLYRPNFFDAAKSGNTETVLKFLNKGQNINAFDKKGWTALGYAARNGHVDVIKALVVHQAAINYPSHSFAWTPLHHASKEGHASSVKLLLENGADVHAKTKHGYKPIRFALKNSDYETMKLLHQYGQSLQYISLFKTINAHTKDEEQLEDRKNIVRLLLGNGASLDSKTAKGQSVLHYAASRNDLVGTKIFLELGLDPNETDESGHTLLYMAIKDRYSNIVGLLLKNGVDINSETSPDWNALHLAVSKSNAKSLEIIIKYAQEVDRRDHQGLTPFHIAAQRGSDDKMKLLFEAGANINAQDLNGWTPLHYAAKWKPYYDDSGEQWSDTEPRALKFLLDNNVDESIKNNEGLTALDLAKTQSEEKILGLLGHVSSADFE